MLHFPAVISRLVLARSGYLHSFPDLFGMVNVFEGGDELHAELLARLEHGEEWAELLTPSDVALCSAACHQLYPLCSGRLPAGGRRLEVFGHCFRHEPSLDPARMQAFRMHEIVYLGDPEGAVAHRDLWLERSADLLSGLGLAVDAVVANDPFFGRAGRMLASNQHAETLKYEIACVIQPDAEPTAISSSNYHLDHFGIEFGIESANGDVVVGSLDGSPSLCWPRTVSTPMPGRPPCSPASGREPADRPQPGAACSLPTAAVAHESACGRGR